ncbi:LacI family DNA-binding transcriptional regulator [Actinoplanes sp. NEAU-A12]|uniref:LacI family DNA-binding transcriptional regulator n=1 Tax=Actinoplanes sandaracinus TaxID=3045177 RepID=A0ABT6X1K6_9ACTN|nr:LacI family DNA-binding transcriptional regulator [Actinoplanes sandaracinus]MDI6105725.1 LacI family DNA-binding transcriptional regulator [Actinoplanes sandaracinus]
MRDVARLAGVSVTTVGNVLNRPHVVAADTRTRVEQAMAQANFVRSSLARQLKGSPSPVVGVVILDMRNPFYSELSRAVEDHVFQVGCTLMVCSTDGQFERERRVLAALEEQAVRGIIVTPGDRDLSHIEALGSRGTPVVLADYASPDADLCSVSVDHHLGGRLVAEHLLELGHRRLAFIQSEVPMQSTRERYRGFRETLRAAGLDPNRSLFDVSVEALPSVGFDEGVIDAIVSCDDVPTAVVCMNDVVARGVLSRLTSRGIRVPEDMSVIGYDDTPFISHLSPSLTTVRQPTSQVGHEAAELLLSEREPNHAHRQIQFRPTLVVRGSTGAPRSR